jgi:hypothetical protein
MNEETKQEDVIIYKFSIAKLLIWVSVVFAVMIPFVSLGASITAMMMAEEENKKEVYTVSAISIALATFFTIMNFIW